MNKKGSKNIKDRLIGVSVTLISSAIMFLVYSYFGSFETKADSNTKYHALKSDVKLILCYMNQKHCTKQMLINIEGDAQ